MGRDDHPVFISYAEENRQWASTLKTDLHVEGFNCWMAGEDARHGAEWISEIDKAIKSCGAFVVIWSKQAKESKWISKEVISAINRHKHIFVARFDDTELPITLNDRQTSDMYEDRDKAWDGLVCGLRHVFQDIELSQEEQAREDLLVKSAKELLDQIVIPLFEKEGWKTEAANYEACGCNIVLTLPGHENSVLEGVRVHRRNMENAEEQPKIALRDASKALKYDHHRGSSVLRLGRFYWITISKIEERSWIEVVNTDLEYGRRIEVWDVEDLIKRLRSSQCEHLLPPLAIDRLEGMAIVHEAYEEMIFAAYYHYRIFDRHLSNGLHMYAKKALVRARSLVDREPMGNNYYRRVLARYYDMWIALLDNWKYLDVKSNCSRIDIVKSTNAMRILGDLYGAKAQLIVDLEYAFDQIDALKEATITTHANLAEIRITRFLLRVGISPKEPSIENRLGYICEELRDEGWKSIDKECSLCTGIAVSCYALAHNNKLVKTAVKWLKGLSDCRFSHLKSHYTSSDPKKHALHFASQVLTGFLDYDSKDNEATADVEEVFFRPPSYDDLGFNREWIMYRNVGSVEVCANIFSAFLRYILAGRTLSDSNADLLKEGLERMISYLRRSVEPSVHFTQLYDTRENLGSFCLGMILGVGESSSLAGSVMEAFRKRAPETANTITRNRRVLWDSNIDRTQIFVEGVFQYWETILFLEGHGVEDMVDDSRR